MQVQQEKLERGEFEAELCRQVLYILGGEYQTELSLVRKNNGVMKTALHIRRENSECIPCFYMDELYRSYCMGENEIALAEYLANIVREECEHVKEKASEYLHKEWIREHLFLRLVQLKTNEEWLQEAVYVPVLDFAAVFYVVTEDTEDGVKSYQLPRRVWESLELGDAEAYFPIIVKNTQRLFPEKLWCVKHNIAECRIEGADIIKEVLPEQESLYSYRLYVLSNHRQINGATVLLYPGLLQRIGEMFSGSFYLIPSSVHEVLLLKETREEGAGFLNRMVREVNEQKVEPEEVLADHVYYYSVKEQRLVSRTE